MYIYIYIYICIYIYIHMYYYTRTLGSLALELGWAVGHRAESPDAQRHRRCDVAGASEGVPVDLQWPARRASLDETLQQDCHAPSKRSARARALMRGAGIPAQGRQPQSTPQATATHDRSAQRSTTRPTPAAADNAPATQQIMTPQLACCMARRRQGPGRGRGGAGGLCGDA